MTDDADAATQNPGSLQEIELAITQLESGLNSPTYGQIRPPAFQAVDFDRLTELYYSKYEITGDQSALDSAKSSSSAARLFGWQAMTIAPPGLTNVAQWCGLQGERLTLRHQRFGETKDLDEAIDAYQAALTTLPDGSALRPVILKSQANCLCTRYEAAGSGNDLDDAIQKAKEALATAGPSTASAQNDLSTMYLLKYERDKKFEDLVQALQLSRVAVRETDENDAMLPTRLLNLANVLSKLYNIGEEMKWLEEKIRILGKAEEAGKAHRAACLPEILSRLAHDLYTRYTRANTSADVFAALKKGREALELAEEYDDHEIHGNLSGLVHACSEEARELDSGDEVQEADMSVKV